jgi:hypothetical protein
LALQGLQELLEDLVLLDLLDLQDQLVHLELMEHLEYKAALGQQDLKVFKDRLVHRVIQVLQEHLEAWVHLDHQDH